MSLHLTEREREIIKRYSSGEGVVDIARALFIAPKTVRYHIRMLGVKLPGEGRATVKIVRWYFNNAA